MSNTLPCLNNLPRTPPQWRQNCSIHCCKGMAMRTRRQARISHSRKPRDKLLSEAGTAVKEFMEAGWEILYCEKYLYRNRQNGDIFISAEGLTQAQSMMNNVTPQEIKEEVQNSVERLGREWQEFYECEDDSTEY